MLHYRWQKRITHKEKATRTKDNKNNNKNNNNIYLQCTINFTSVRNWSPKITIKLIKTNWVAINTIINFVITKGESS